MQTNKQFYLRTGILTQPCSWPAESIGWHVVKGKKMYMLEVQDKKITFRVKC